MNHVMKLNEYISENFSDESINDDSEIKVGDTVLYLKPNERILNTPAYGTVEKRNGRTTSGKKKWTVNFEDPKVMKGFKIKGGLRLTISETRLKKK